MHNKQQKGKRNMSQNVLVVHGGGPTAVINASLYGVIEEVKSMKVSEKIAPVPPIAP